MADREMFVDAIAQGLALVAPELDDPDRTADRLVGLIGVWEPAQRSRRADAGVPTDGDSNPAAARTNNPRSES